ncbi:Mfa1 family fimbria major subunit [Proteiniphilum sp. X52]|uniref:Mfa1 family fimbria major subunit n=1 Tax=Proteiniphilum sp. X52 TaxID=2382159 RepID=UPI000F09A5D7|nr:Mfa1 family fimbria major subunit [Proteiniphilum sp. X52]RNC65386.1 hypothetical protein D7D25_07785 [Proteiniphilum sp. X52]
MNKVTKFLMTATIVFGFAACNNDNVPPLPQEEGNTHVSVALTMSTPGTKAATRSQDYNYVGQWAGKDKINSVAVFIVEGTTVTTGQFTAADFNIANPGDGTITLTPLKAIKTTPGTKKVYALINGTPQVVAKLATANATNFEAAYQTEALKLANDYPTNPSVQSSASNIAQIDGDNDVIVMTNSEAASVNVQEGVTEAQALAGQNRAKVNVKRTVARVMVTTTTTSYEVKASNGTITGTVSDITWVLAQGENSLFLQQKAGLETPQYTFKPTATDYYTTGDNGYDYSGLFEAQGNKLGGTDVPTLADYAGALEDVTDKQLNQKLSGKFILPTTHAYGADAATTGYVKGNTAYVLVRAKFTPREMADGTAYTDGNDFYLGANGLFYSSKANAQNPETGGIEGQTVARYVGGKVLYYAWVNPDKVPGWLNSPVVRNNIYHIHISGFKTIGTNWNPLVPNDDPTTTEDDQNNPDPKPTDPDNPNQPDPDEPDNPIDPEDPLTTPETWMSVDMTVLPWEVHTYEVDLEI